jgi:regulator of protease activity HflC (stomatin/prohibitin superfamily)
MTMGLTTYLPGIAGLLGAIAAVFAGINGFNLIHEGEQGLLKRFGRVKRDRKGHPQVLEPGFRMLVPWAYVVIKRSVKLQTLSLSQQFVTKDGLVYAITAIINFKIKDIYKALIEVTTLDDYMKSVGTMIIHEQVTSVTNDEDSKELIPNLEYINKALKSEILSREEEWGVEVIDFAIVSFAPTAQAQQVLSISARVRLANTALVEFFGSKEKSYEHPQIAAAVIGTPVSTTVN